MECKARRHVPQLALLEYKLLQDRHGFHLLLPLPFLPIDQIIKLQLTQSGEWNPYLGMVVAMMVWLQEFRPNTLDRWGTNDL
jgi:hypothetical protein